MAIITDPDLLTRFSVIFGTNQQQVSIYPVGDTQRGSNAYACWVSNTSTITSNAASFTSITTGDVACVLIGADAGHYYVQAGNTSSITLADIDSGTSGAAITSLTVDDDTVEAVTNAANTLTLTAHSYVTGDAVVFDDGGGTAPTGLTDLTVYYVIRDDANTIRLATSYANALAGTGVNITSDGTGTFTLHKRLIVAVFNNGASTSEQIGGNPTSGGGDGDVLDGATLQALYSFAKEEWRTDSLITGMTPNYNDDLIRHQFPFEAITSEQFEIGGGASHDNWIWFNSYTRKKVRTAGWAEKTTVSAVNDLARETGIVTLGFLESDTQVYYQQTSTTTNPVNFTFLGAVNEAIRIYYDADQNGTPDNNFTTYLKLFARKKGLTYTQSTIADIGVSTIQTIVNRFPLAHATDTAITATDGEILGTSPFRDTATVTLADTIDGSKSGTHTFTDADQTFQTAGVVPGDTLRITSGDALDQGYYTIASVDSETSLTLVSDFEKTGWNTTEGSITYSITTPYLVAVKAGDGTVAVKTGGVLADVDSVTGTITEAGQFGSVAVGDILWIQEAPHQGVYRVVSIAGAPNAITVETVDRPFTAATVDYMVLESGIYLEYKKDSVTNAAPASYAFDAANGTYGGRPTITRADGTWDAGIDAGTIIEIASSENTGENDGSYTVFARESSTILSLVPTDVLITNATDTTAVVAVYEGFRRTIGSGTYAFNWKVKSNGTGLANIYQYLQHQLRQSTDIDYGGGTSRGDITDLLMSFASPTGTGINTYFDNLDTNDINNVTFQDHSGVNRNFPFVAAGSLVFNTNLTTDTNAKYWLFFSNDDAGDNLGRDYGTKDAIIVKDQAGSDIAGNISAQPSISFTYDYDGNVQRGSASAGTNAPVTLVAIGLDTAQFVISTGTISRTTGITISAVAALERNYLNAV